MMYWLQLNGFLGGIHLAILAAFVCQCDPFVGLSALISHFFKKFAFWPWPRPVELQDETLHPTLNPTETRLYMPIRLPFSSYEYCHSNITKSTFYKIRTEFLRGHNLTKVQFVLYYSCSFFFLEHQNPNERRVKWKEIVEIDGMKA